MFTINWRRQGGFTLIEMLVVVGIIGVLASLILVGLGGARRAGADAKKIANLNQVRNALELYHLRNGAYPPTPTGNLITNINQNELDVGRLGLDNTYYYVAQGTSYLIGTTLSEGNSGGLRTGTIGTRNCNDDQFYCLTAE